MNKIRSPASYTHKLLCLFCREKFCKKIVYYGVELICEVCQTMLYHNQNLFLIASCCFCLFGEFAKVFERQVGRVRVAHLHSAVRLLSSPSRCFFRLSTIRDNDLFRCLLSWDATTIRQKATNIMCVSFT